MKAHGGRWRLPIPVCLLSLILLLGGALPGLGFALNGYAWPAGTQVRMYVQLSRAPMPLQDGSASWNASAVDALNIWNQYLAGVTFVQAGPSFPGPNDGTNSVSIARTIYGKSWPYGTLAVTINYSSEGSGVFTETDVIFNDNINWDSYRGPIQGSGPTGTYDLHRVALHEFGHVLGLDHPDQHGQNVSAMMNSIISDLDELADDDIAGVQAIYGTLKITSPLNPVSVVSGNSFSYQITANQAPSSYAASGLPPGLQLNASSGLISGSCPTSGTFPVDLTVQSGFAAAKARLQITVTPLPITSGSFVQVQIGAGLNYQILAGNSPTSFAATGLPVGLGVDAGTGLISGVPQVAGNFTVKLTARSATSEAAGNINLVVMPPRLTSGNPQPVELGDPLSFQVTATNAPTSFSASGMPSGFQIDPSSGIITGTGKVAGGFSVTVTAQTSYGPATGTVFITVLAPRITSLSPIAQDVGSTYNYQITASNHPYAFSATGLPPGLVLDPATGKITGTAELSGNYQVSLTAVGALGTATTTMTMTVLALEVSDPPLARLPLSILGSIVADPLRPRVYVPVSEGIAVVDTNSLTVVQTIPMNGFFAELCVSGDGSRLWATSYVDSKIRAIDLNTLTVIATLTTSRLPRMIREGADGYLYVTDYGRFEVAQIDPNTGATISAFTPAPNIPGNHLIEMSPDRKTLYVAVLNSGSDVPLAKYSLSAGNPPVLLQRVETTGSQGFGRKLAVDPRGGAVSIAVQEGIFAPVSPTQGRSTADLNTLLLNFASPSAPSQLAYSPDGAFLFQAVGQRSRIDVFRAGDGKLARTITLPDRAMPAGDSFVEQSLAVDRTNSLLFVSSVSFPKPGLYVYSLATPPAAVTPPKSLLNIATRMRTQAGDNALIGGFIVSGQGPKQLVLRAIGPSLPVAGKLADPVLQLYDSTGALIAENDNWNAHRADVIATGIAPLDEHEAVVATTLQPGSYTAVVRGVNNTTGVALVEAYDLNPGGGSRLANISTRGKVEAGDSVMIGGFILGGDQFTNVVVRGIGPSLANFGVPGVLADPWLEVYDGNGTLIAQDDDWRLYQEQQLTQTGLAPGDDREAAMMLLLQPGAYTAIVRGKDNTTGVGLVEVYNLETN